MLPWETPTHLSHCSRRSIEGRAHACKAGGRGGSGSEGAASTFARASANSIAASGFGIGVINASVNTDGDGASNCVDKLPSPPVPRSPTVEAASSAPSLADGLPPESWVPLVAPLEQLNVLVRTVTAKRQWYRIRCSFRECHAMQRDRALEIFDEDPHFRDVRNFQTSRSERFALTSLIALTSALGAASNAPPPRSGRRMPWTRTENERRRWESNPFCQRVALRKNVTTRIGVSALRRVFDTEWKDFPPVEA
jgi:hypothetical protein